MMMMIIMMIHCHISTSRDFCKIVLMCVTISVLTEMLNIFDLHACMMFLIACTAWLATLKILNILVV
jgi:hypothetical protein